MTNYRHAHILGLMSLAMASFGLAIGTEIRTTAIMAGLLAAAAVATVVHEKRLLARPAAVAGAPAQSGSMVTTKRMLMLLMAIGIVVYAGGAGTFSSFSAETSNRNSSIASGTLTMSNTVNTGSACLSSNANSADNYQTGCDVALTLTNQAPGVFGGASKITIANTGSIDASQLTVYAPYVNATLSTQVNLGTTISSLATTALEGNVSSGDTIELDYGGQSLQMVAGANVSPTKTAISIASPGSQSCTLSTVSTSATCTSTTALRAGMTVTGTGIPASTTISSVTNGTTIVLSATPTSNGAQTLTFTVKASINFPVGTRVYDTSSNVSPTTTDCYDQIQQAALPVNQPNFNGTDIGDGSHWDSTDNYCRTLLFWIQEQSNPTPAQSATTTSGSPTVTVANGALLNQALNGGSTPPVVLSVSGTNVPANTTITAVSGNTITLSQNATASGSTTLTFTANNCWVGPGSGATTTNMCYAPIGANFPGSGTTTISNATTSITFASALQGNIKSGDTLTISEPTKKVVTCTTGQDAYIGATTVTVSGCTSTASGWVPATGETFDGATASSPAIAATIVDTTMNNLLNSNTTDTISNFDTAHGFGNKLELPPLTANGTHTASGGGTSNIELAKKGSTGDTRVFYVGVFFPAGSGAAQNATQGLTSTFGLSWKIQQ